MTVDILILTDSREQRRSQKKYWYSMKCDLNGELKKAEGIWRTGRNGRRYGDIQRDTESQRQGEGRKAPMHTNTRQHAPIRANTYRLA